MKLDTFDYPLPEELIAQKPLKKRDDARLLIANRQKQTIQHDYFFNLGKYLPSNSTIVMNESKVLPARLLGYKKKSGGQVEIFLLKQLEDPYTYEALLKPLKKIPLHDDIVFENSNLVAQLMDKEKRIVRFNKKDISKDLEKIGHMPLPPYIKRDDEKSDREFYQTVYAKKKGSVAAPTAGLHFTSELIAQLKQANHLIETVTLHVGYGTFKPVEVKNIKDHQMHTEEYFVSQKTFQVIQRTKKRKKQVVAIGTTSCRVLETLAKTSQLKGSTNIFISPGFTFQSIDALVTNFHLPLSTLLMLVYAFGGVEFMKKVYEEAIAKKYRFFSYGDAMLIL